MAARPDDSDREYLVSLPAPDDLPLLGDADDTTRGVVLVTLAGLLLRLVALGARPAHFDEGRVAYFTEYFIRTGAFEYRSIIHGPFVQHANSVLFSVIGPTDFASRLVVALVGAALPLPALLLRHRLQDTETLALAFLLAFNPVLLYYSRFSRSSILVAGFMFAAFAFFVYAFDTRDVRPVYWGVLLAGFGFASKENAVLYVLCWLGAGALVADRALFGPRDYDGGTDRLRALYTRLREWADADALVRGASHGVLLAVLFVVVLVFFYAPRGAGSPVTVNGEAIGLYGLHLNPGAFGGVMDATVADIEKVGYWFSQSGTEGGEPLTVGGLIEKFRNFGGQTAETYAYYGAAIAAFGVLGFLYERYAAAEPRPLVMFASYWAFASAIGYPIGTDIYGAWITVNILVPLAIPAAVALAGLYRVGRESFAEDDRVSVGLVALLFLLVGGQMAVATANGVYLNDDSADGLVQYAQPSDSTREATEAMRRATRDGADPAVLVYGDRYVDNADDFVGLGDDDIRVPLHTQCLKFFPSLSMPWYHYKDDVPTTCALNESQFQRAMAEEPPVVYAPVAHEPVLDQRLEGYDKSRFYLRTAAGDRKETVLYVRTDD
jgi:uncharacterized protein (TIGR03663 family)